MSSISVNIIDLAYTGYIAKKQSLTWDFSKLLDATTPYNFIIYNEPTTNAPKFDKFLDGLIKLGFRKGNVATCTTKDTKFHHIITNLIDSIDGDIGVDFYVTTNSHNIQSIACELCDNYEGIDFQFLEYSLKTDNREQAIGYFNVADILSAYPQSIRKPR